LAGRRVIAPSRFDQRAHLIAHTQDEQLASHEASQRAAERIPGARFVSLESGGHLMIGQTKIVRDELARFFAEMPDRGAERVAS
jgi:pimeloyl-ACP methyl ester carboxylesterase